MTVRRTMAMVSILLAIVVTVTAWVGLGRIEVGASDSLTSVSDALVTVQDSLGGTSDVVIATADALDAAAESLETAAVTSDSTAVVARDIADVAETLPPVVVAITDGLIEVDVSFTRLAAALDTLPFGLGDLADIDPDRLQIDDIIASTDPLVNELAESQDALEQLAVSADALGPDTRELAASLRSVADELRASTDNVSELAENVADTQRTLDDVVADDEIDLIWIRVGVVAMAFAVALAAGTALVDKPPSSSGSHRPSASPPRPDFDS